MASPVAIELDPRHTEECERLVREQIEEFTAAEFFSLPGQYVLAGIAASSNNVESVTAVYSLVHFAYASAREGAPTRKTIDIRPSQRRRWTVTYPARYKEDPFPFLPASTVNPASCLPPKPRVGIKRPRLHSDYDIARRVRPRSEIATSTSVQPSDSASNA